jgi:hypothetical protein
MYFAVDEERRLIVAEDGTFFTVDEFKQKSTKEDEKCFGHG